jgi:hypothetical protein
MPGLVSATGVLAFLGEEEPELKVFALQTLNDDIDTVWTEVAGTLIQMYDEHLSSQLLCHRCARFCGLDC